MRENPARKYDALIAHLLDRSEGLESLKRQLERDASTAEEWTAIRQLADAHRYVYSAAMHLTLHDTLTTTREETS